MKRLLLFLILIASVSAVSFEGYKYSDEPFLFDDTNFTLRLSGDWNSLIFTNDYTNKIISKGDCGTTDFYRYCYINNIVDFENDLGKVIGYEDDISPALNITIESLKADVSIVRVASNLNPNEYEDVEVIVTITNEGQNSAYILYEEVIDAKTCKQCAISNGEVIYSITLIPKSEKTFSYVVNADEIKTLDPNVTYKTDLVEGELPLATLTITPVKTLVITYTGETTVLLENSIKGKFTFKNNDAKEDLKFKSSTNAVNTTLDKKTFEGILDAGEEISFDVIFSGTTIGKETLFMKTNYELGSNEIKINQTFDITTIVDKPKIVFAIDTNIFSDKKNNVELSFENGVNNFKDFKVDINIPDVKNQTFLMPFLRYKHDVKAYSYDFSSIYNTQKVIDVKLDINYKTFFGETIIYSIISKVTVKPLINMFDIEHELEGYDEIKGYFTVQTFIKNNNDEAEKITIKENIVGADILTKEGNDLYDQEGYLTKEEIIVESLASKKFLSYVIEKNTSPIIQSRVFIKGLQNNYVLTQITQIDFDTKTFKIINKTLDIIGANKVEEETGVLIENIEAEKTFEEEIVIEEEIVVEEEKVVEPEPEKTAAMPKVQIKKEKSFFKKVIDVIMSFF